MHETAVQLQVAVDMPKRILPMAVVEVGVAAEHLFDYATNVGVKVGRESG